MPLRKTETTEEDTHKTKSRAHPKRAAQAVLGPSRDLTIDWRPVHGALARVAVVQLSP